MLDIHRLRIFRSVVASGSIQAAAGHLGFSPSAVSQHVATLQRELGVTLVEKSGRGIVPTAAGRILASESDDVIENIARLQGIIDDLRDGRTGRLTIGYFPSSGATWMPEIARVLTEELPDVVLELTLNELQGADIARQADLELVAEPIGPEPITPVGYRRIPLAVDPYTVVLSEDHPLADRETIVLSELANDNWVSNDFTGGSCFFIESSAFKAAGFTPRFAFQTQDHYSAIAFVSHGVGVTLLPRLATTVVPPNVRVIPVVDPSPERRISVLVRETLLSSPAVSTALRVLRELTEPVLAA